MINIRPQNWVYTDREGYIFLLKGSSRLQLEIDLTGLLERPFETSIINVSHLYIAITPNKREDLSSSLLSAVKWRLIGNIRGVREKLGWLWSSEDEDKFWCFNQFLNESERLFEQGRYKETAYFLTECFRIVAILEEKLALKSTIDSLVAPIVILVLAAFSILMARLIASNKTGPLAAIIFLVSLAAFSYIHPYVQMLLVRAPVELAKAFRDFWDALSWWLKHGITVYITQPAPREIALSLLASMLVSILISTVFIVKAGKARGMYPQL